MGKNERSIDDEEILCFKSRVSCVMRYGVRDGPMRHGVRDHPETVCKETNMLSREKEMWFSYGGSILLRQGGSKETCLLCQPIPPLCLTCVGFHSTS